MNFDKKEHNRQYYLKNKKQILEDKHQYYLKNKERIKQVNIKYRKENGKRLRVVAWINNPKAVQARRQLRNAVGLGKIIKPCVCEDCHKKFPKKKIQGHHFDYSKPFEVIWLCQECHRQLHQEKKETVMKRGI